MSRCYPALIPTDDVVEREHLATYFEEAERSTTRAHLVGTELENFGVVVRDGDDPTPLPYPVRHADHVVPVLEGLITKFGWAKVEGVGESGALVELSRDDAKITLEPGGQVELSGKPLANVHDTCDEFTTHYGELHAVSEPLGIAWLACGHHPFATRDEIDWVPKGRYRVMRRYLPTRGSRALDMMIRTSTVQANFDFASEKQCGLRYGLALALGPLVGAMFANSPYVEGRPSGAPTIRPEIWSDVDPDRCGIPGFMFDGEAFSYERYVDWALDVPMFFVVRESRYHAHHVTFREYMQDGFRDRSGCWHRATWADWERHLGTLFPDIRLRPFIEVRTTDAVGSRYVCAQPALWRGLLYDEDACAAATEIVPDDRDERESLWAEAHEHGVRSPKIKELCVQLLKLSRDALDRMDIRDDKDRTEARFLDPLQETVEAGRCPGDDIVDSLGPAPGRDAKARRNLVDAFHFAGAKP
jgi:glutamate--cysteine ligase